MSGQLAGFLRLHSGGGSRVETAELREGGRGSWEASPLLEADLNSGRGRETRSTGGIPRSHYKAAAWRGLPSTRSNIRGEKMGGSGSGPLLLLLLLLRGLSAARTTTSLALASESSTAWYLQVVSSVNGSVDDRGICHCSVLVPQDAFPVKRVEVLEVQARSLTQRYDRELSKVTKYIKIIDASGQKLLNLTERVEHMHKSQVSYTELDFEMVKVEIQETENLISQLKVSMGDSNVVVQQLYVEIKNISLMVTHLESLDKNNILAIRREIVILKQRLKECENPESVQPGSCNHGGLVNISKPYPIQWNWRGPSYLYGVWGKDYSPDNPENEVYWVSALDDKWLMQHIHLYSSYDNLLLNRSSKTFAYKYGQGTGATMYKHFLYFNCYNTSNVCKFDLKSKSVVLKKELPGVAFNIDLLVDETGLWAVYSTEANTGNVVISKLNEDTLGVQKTWSTQHYKPSVSSAFIICGVLYVTRSNNTKQEEIFYTFDTRTGKEGRVSILMDKPFGTVQGLNYHPADHKLYVYNDGFLVTYQVGFRRAAP
ncbi:olfactomedin-4-like [Elgaria multicarinata webbii]|uniref:olfactomedin-4-like n=1 Tax=Elgaria multicarinata webbii TaxID=159646 RepID=UPI002FCD536B